MKRLSKVLILLTVAIVCAIGLVACGDESAVDKLKKDGYLITVTYDSNGGRLLLRDGVSITDMYNPNNYTADSNNKIHLTLVEPTDNTVRTDPAEIKISNAGYFLTGWYQTRELAKNADGEVLSEDGRALRLDNDGNYHYKTLNEGELDLTVNPAYTYDGKWDFSTDKLEYEMGSGKKEITLYAGWVKNFSYNFYEVDENSNTKLVGTYSFIYEDSASGDIVVPNFKDSNGNDQASMNYYNFPKVDGKTFNSAYSDVACTNAYTGEKISHLGTLDVATASSENAVQNVYLKYDNYVLYKIRTPEELTQNAKTNGYYELQNDLDFTNKAWSGTFSQGSFTGKMFAKSGTVKISNVNYEESSLVEYGGLFGTIEKGAAIENVTFENITYSVKKGAKNSQKGYFGTFAGYLDKDATLTNVSLENAKLRLGWLNIDETTYIVNLVANSDSELSGLTVNGVELYAYSVNNKYYVKDDTTVDANNQVTVKLDVKGTSATEAEKKIY